MQNIFNQEFQPKKIIDNPSEEQLRDWALDQGGIITEFGNLSVVTQTRNRIAKFTEVVVGEFNDAEDKQLVHQVMDGTAPDPSTLTKEMANYYKTTRVLMGESLYSHSWLEV